MANIFKQDRPQPWTVQWKDVNGKRKSKSFLTHAEAKAHKASVEHTIKPIKASGILLNDAIVKYIQSKESDAKSAQTIERYYRSLKNLHSQLLDMPISDITVEDIEAWKEERHDCVGNRTVYNDLKNIRVFLSWCVKKGHCGANVAKEVTLPTYEEYIPTWPNKEQVDLCLIDAQKKRNDFYRVLLLAGYAGLRIGDCRQLRVKDLDFDSNVIRVQIGKSKKPRIVPMHSRIRDEFKGIDGEWVFPSSRDPEAHVSEELKRKLNRWLKATHPECGSIHSFRHSFASRYAEGGATHHELMQVLGHVSFQTTLMYLHHSDVRQQKMIDNL